MNYDEIMRNIIDSLTGDPGQDITYLRRQIACYKEHDQASEIMQGINHLIYHLLPEEAKKEIELELQRNAIRNERTLKASQSLISQEAYGKAVLLLEKLILDEDGPDSPFTNDSASEYYAFHNFFEEVLFRELYHFRKIIRPVPGDFSGMYFLYGCSLLGLGRREEAKQSLEKALRWNPMNLTAMFLLAEASRADGDEEGSLWLIRRGFRSAYTSADLARCYRMLEAHYRKKGEESLADMLAAFGLAFEGDSPLPRAELDDLTQRMRKGSAVPPRLAEIWEDFKAGEIPVGPNPVILDLAVSLGHKALKEGANVSARFLFGIAYDLTRDEKVQYWMDSIPEEEIM